jgi:anti-sigma B factor antagonist
MRYFGGPNVETKVENQGAVVSLHGKVTLGVGDVKLRKTILELLDEGVTNIVIDLEDVTTMDSCGIGELVAAYTAVSEKGGHLTLRHLPPKV